MQRCQWTGRMDNARYRFEVLARNGRLIVFNGTFIHIGNTHHTVIVILMNKYMNVLAFFEKY